MMYWHIMSNPHAGLSAGMLTLPSVLPDPGVAPQQNMTVPSVSELSPGLQAPAQAAGGCSGAPQFQASSFACHAQVSCKHSSWQSVNSSRDMHIPVHHAIQSRRAPAGDLLDSRMQAENGRLVRGECG